MIPDPLNGYGVHTGACTAVGCKGPKGIISLLGHDLSAVANGLCVGNVVRRGILCGIGSPKAGSRYM